MTIIVPNRAGFCERCGRRRPGFRHRPRQRYSPRRNRWLDTMNAGGIQVGSSGIQVNASGVIVTDSDSSTCCCGPAACGSCTTTPTAWTVTFSGITLCACVGDGSGFGSLLPTGNPNGTFTVPFFSGGASCLWKGVFPGQCTLQYYASSSGCSGTPATFDYTVTVQIGASGSVSVGGIWSDPSLPSGSHRAFSANTSLGAISGDCRSQTFALSNALLTSGDCGGSFGLHNYGYGGSSTSTSSST